MIVGGGRSRIIGRYYLSPLYSGWRRRRRHGAYLVCSRHRVFGSFGVDFALCRFLRCSVTKFSMLKPREGGILTLSCR